VGPFVCCDAPPTGRPPRPPLKGRRGPVRWRRR
jgi:hypothetical protein